MTIATSEFNNLTLRELYGILRLRSEVFAVEQECCYQDLDGLDLDATHVWVEQDGEILGCLRVYADDGSCVRIGRVATSRKVRGKGWGKEMMTVAIRAARERWGNVPILLHAQSYATGFYEKLGFMVSSEEFLEEGIPHYEMTLSA